MHFLCELYTTKFFGVLINLYWFCPPLQDISFFDNETVGDLTSRLGADCQQVSRVIGNDLNLILRNVLQVAFQI